MGRWPALAYYVGLLRRSPALINWASSGIGNVMTLIVLFAAVVGVTFSLSREQYVAAIVIGVGALVLGLLKLNWLEIERRDDLILGTHVADLGDRYKTRPKWIIERLSHGLEEDQAIVLADEWRRDIRDTIRRIFGEAEAMTFDAAIDDVLPEISIHRAIAVLRLRMDRLDQLADRQRQRLIERAVRRGDRVV